MLHNTGSYGPNEAPVNMGAPVNVSQLGAPLNVAQNLSNLGKTPQHPPQAAGGHFSLPNYASYMAANPNMGPQMHTFPNYQSFGLQSSYMHHNSPALPNMSWQNGMLPMNFNFHNEAVHNASNYSTNSTRASSSVNSYKEQIYTPKVPLNVPQVPNNFFLRHFEDENDRQTLPNYIKPIENELSSNCSEKPFGSLLKDNPRRKNLENTVRLIENILVNTTKNREMQLESQSSCAKNVETDSKTKNMNAKLNNTDTLSKELEKEKTEECSRESKTDEDSNSSDRSSQKECDVKIVENKETTITENRQELEISIKLEPEDNYDVEEIREVEVKIEPITSWTDTEHSAPFHRDVHGVLQEDIGRENVIDSENSVLEATKIIVNKETSDNYFECPYCCLIFKHPKRFLIHTKWHLFGPINEQRLELAKEKESRRNQRKETRQKGAGAVRKPWPCKDCDKVFHAKGGLESHRKRFHSNRIRECKMCSKSVDGWTAWKAHIATHKSELGYQCTHCPKRFKYSHSLTKHKDTHLEKTHACPDCPKMFGSPALLKVHSKSHERLQKGASFHCSFCGKAFFDKFNLQIHERTHTNERPFICEICNASFGCNSNLSRHMKVSHSSTKPYECSTCHRSFTSEGIRDRHELRMHGDPEDFKYACKQCPSRYMKLNELKKHTYKCHPKSRSKKMAEDDDEDDEAK